MTSTECKNKPSVCPAAKCQEVELFVETVADRNTQTKLTISHKYPHTNSVQYDTGLPTHHNRQTNKKTPGIKCPEHLTGEMRITITSSQSDLLLFLYELHLNNCQRFQITVYPQRQIYINWNNDHTWSVKGPLQYMSLWTCNMSGDVILWLLPRLLYRKSGAD